MSRYLGNGLKDHSRCRGWFPHPAEVRRCVAVADEDCPASLNELAVFGEASGDQRPPVGLGQRGHLDHAVVSGEVRIVRGVIEPQVVELELAAARTR